MAKLETEVINTHIISFMRQSVYTSIPAVVVRADERASQVVDVKPLINRVYEDGSVLDPSIILDVPVVFPSAAGGILSFPINAGDTVLLVFSMRSIDEWVNGEGGQTTPSNNRHHHLSDAIAIPGLYTKNNNLSPNLNDVELKFNGLSVRLEKESGDIVMQNPTHSFSLKADGSVLHSSGARITPNGDFVTASGISLDGHTHPQGPDSDGNTEQDTGPPQ